jgi:hypothetical protein
MTTFTITIHDWMWAVAFVVCAAWAILELWHIWLKIQALQSIARNEREIQENRERGQ